MNTLHLSYRYIFPMGTQISFLMNLKYLFLCHLTFQCQVFIMTTLLFKDPPCLSMYSSKWTQALVPSSQTSCFSSCHSEIQAPCHPKDLVTYYDSIQQDKGKRTFRNRCGKLYIPTLKVVYASSVYISLAQS